MATKKPKKKKPAKIPKLNTVEASILKSLNEAICWAKGEDVPGVRVIYPNIPARLDIKAIRKRLDMSQAEFAVRFGFSPSTLRNWEQGTRQPETTARILLTIIDRAPDVVERVLRG